MAKRQMFGEEARRTKGAHRKMVKVIISAKSARGKYGFKEAMIEQDEVKNFIDQSKEK